MKMKNIALTLTAMLAVCYGIAQAQTLVAPAPLLWLGLNGNLTDQGGSTNLHAVSFVGSGCSFQPDVANVTAGTDSLYFDGDGSHVIVTNASDLNFNTGVPFTIAAWINTSVPGVIVAKVAETNYLEDAGSTAKSLAWMVFDDGGLTLDDFYSGGWFYGAGVTVNNGQWIHCALTYDGTTYTEYTNGVFASTSGPGQPGCDEGRQGEPPWTLELGWTDNSIWPVTGGNVNGPYTGYMDEVAVWNSALTADQIGSVYSNGVPTVSVTILKEPADTNILAGQAASFTVAAMPFGTTGTLHYQWQTNDVNISGATSPNYSIPATPAGYNGLRVRCLVTIGSISVATREANLSVVAVSLAPAPLLWLPFEGSLADRGADAASHTASFVLTGAYFTNDVAGSSTGTNSLYLPGGGTCVQITGVSDLNFNTGGGGFTISAWIKTTGVGGIATKCPPPSYVITDTGAGPHTPALFVNDVTLGWNVFYGGDVESVQLVNDGKWHNVVVTYDGQSTGTLYVDGFYSASGTCAGANEGQYGEPAWDLWLGWTPNSIYPAPSDTPNAPYTGEMDDVAVWSGPLSANQIAYVYENGIPPVSIAFMGQPNDTNVLVGDPATFAVAATPFGTNVSLTYQWQTNGVNIAGATSSSYTLPAAQLTDNGTLFSCVVTAGSISLPSRSATLTVYCAQAALSTETGDPANLGYRLVGSTNHPLAVVSFPAALNENTPVSVDLVAANPSVATLQGAVGGKLTLTFPVATTNAQYVPVNCLSVGKASFYLTNLVTPRCGNIAPQNLATVTVYQPGATRTKYETFDTLASTTADGWTGYLNQSTGESYGWSNTSYATGVPADAGEAGGTFERTNSRSYFADTTIGTLTLNEYISATGTVMIVSPPQNNCNIYVTFLNTNDAWDDANANFMGVEFTEGPGNGPNGRFATVLGLADDSFQYGTPDPGAVLNGFDVVPVSWNFAYDPTGGPTGNGEVICNYSSQFGSASMTNDVSADQRAVGATFNAFGLATRDLPFQGAPGEYFLDNVSYTVGGVVQILSIQMLPGNQVRLTYQSGGTTNLIRRTSTLAPASWSTVSGVTYSGPTDDLIWTATFTAPGSPAFFQIVANPNP